jgi:hypothetical protein
MLVVQSDITATVRLDGIPVGQVSADAPLITAGPTRRPFSLELVAPGVMFSRSVTGAGAVHVTAELAALQRDTLEAEPEQEPTATRTPVAASATRTTPRPRDGTEPPPSTPPPAEPPPSEPTTEAPVRLGEPIRPRTQ